MVRGWGRGSLEKGSLPNMRTEPDPQNALLVLLPPPVNPGSTGVRARPHACPACPFS